MKIKGSFVCTSFAILSNIFSNSYCSETKKSINETLMQELNTNNEVKNTLLRKKRNIASTNRLGIAQKEEVRKFFENPNNTTIFNLSKFIISSQQDVIYGKKCDRFIGIISDRLPRFIWRPLCKLCGQNMSLPCNKTNGTSHRGKHSSVFGSLLRALLLRNCILDDDVHFFTKGSKQGKITLQEYGCSNKRHTIDCLNNVLNGNIKLLQECFNHNLSKLKNGKDFTKIAEINSAILEIKQQMSLQTKKKLFERIRWTFDLHNSQNKKSLKEFIEETFLQPAEQFLSSINTNEINNNLENHINYELSFQQDANLSNNNQSMFINIPEQLNAFPKLSEDLHEKETDLLLINNKFSFDSLELEKDCQINLFSKHFILREDFLKDQKHNYLQDFYSEY